MKSRKTPSSPESQELQKIRGDIFEILAGIASAFSTPARLKIVQLLAQCERNVEDLAKGAGESVANVSQHLQRLAKSGIVTCERQGLNRVYRLRSPAVVAMWEKLQDLGHEIDRELVEKENQLTDASLRAEEPIESILRMIESGQAILLDVRETKESASTQVPGATAVSVTSLATSETITQLNLSQFKAVYVCCRGRYCSLATDAVRILRDKGYRAFRIQESPYQLQMLQAKPRVQSR